jgi:hypothetical protein
VAGRCTADTGPWRFDDSYLLLSGHRMKSGALLLPAKSSLAKLRSLPGMTP